MIRSLWEIFRSLVARNTEEGDEESDGFIPSPLDLSVRYSHGSPDAEVERELYKIDKQARELEEKEREQ